MKIGVIFDDFAKSDKNYTLMDKMNSFVNDRNDEVCGFLTNISHKVIDTFFAYTNISDIAHFNNGLVVATSLDGADVMNKTSVNSDKCFYIWQMDWMGIHLISMVCTTYCRTQRLKKLFVVNYKQI